MSEVSSEYAKVVKHYSKDVVPPYVGWVNLNQASFDWGRFAHVNIDSNSVADRYPSALYAHDFKLNIPDNARIEKVDIIFNFSKDGDISFRRPSCKLRIGDSREDEYTIDYERTPLSNSGHQTTLTVKKEGHFYNKLTPSNVNKDNFGVVLNFDDEYFKGKGTVRVHFIKLEVTYTLPAAGLNFANGLHHSEQSAKNGFKKEIYTEFKGTAHLKDLSGIDFGTLEIDVELPLGLKIVRAGGSACSEWKNNRWYVKWDNFIRDHIINFTFLAKTRGIKKIKFFNELTGVFYAYVQVGPSSSFPDLDGEDDVAYIDAEDMRRNVESNIYVKIKGIYDSNKVIYDVPLHNDGVDRWLKVRDWDINKSTSSSEVSINRKDEYFVELNVPIGKEVDIELILTVKPPFEGEDKFYLESHATGNSWDYDCVINPGYKYVLLLRDAEKREDGWYFKTNDPITFTETRLASVIHTGAYSFPCRTHPLDKVMRILRSTLQVHRYKERNYIGPIPLMQTHYDADFSYNDTLLKTTNKNNKFLGKKGAADEKRSLNIRLPPKDVTTLQGLVDMDKPIPINVNHLCFEGDVLNHRGWVELYGIGKVTKTNPSWYDCDISVEYLTHNINARFKINRGNKISTYFLPNLLVNKCYSGDKLLNYFLVNTTGSYLFNDSGINPSKFNSISLENGEFFKISGMDNISPKANFVFRWDSTRVTENKDNDVTRIIRLVDARTLNPVMEYEYYDFNFETSKKYPCKAICRVLNKGAYKTVLNKTINLHYDITAGLSNYDVDTYGSVVNFKIVGDKLTIHDEGFSGKEVYLADIDLENSEYYFEAEFVNNNNHYDAPAIVNTLDFELREIDYSSEYVNYYEKLMVSPFPIPNKTLLFTRESEEGTIFYQLDDGLEASYRLSPFYQYWTGVNLESKDKIQLINLDNSHEVVYMNNGLVKLGINRYNGRLYLYKYDRESKTFIEITKLQLTKYNDININHFTDDKLEIQVSDTKISMWRGRPFIQFNHPTEDILYSSNVNKVWAERVDDVASEFSDYYVLVDDTNKLPACVSNPNNLNSDCIVVNTSESTGSISDLTVSTDAELNMGVSSTINFSSSNLKNVDIHVIINDSFDSIITLNNQGKASLNHTFYEAGKQKITGVFLGNDNYDYCIADVITPTVLNNGYKLEILTPDVQYYLQDTYKARLTLGGEPVEGEVVDFTINGVDYDKTTDAEGIARVNNRLHPGEYLIYAEFIKNEATPVASDGKNFIVKKGISNISIYPEARITRGTPLKVSLYNNLDPEDDDVVDNYIKNENIKLTINGVDYYRVTDSKGEAFLDINLNPGTYDFKVEFVGSRNYMECLGNYEIEVVV